jgi:ArsR family transcriptional regulator
LRLLEEADLVRGEKDGMWSNFRLVKAEEQNAYSSVVLAHLRDWLEDDPQIQILMERTQSVDREKCTAG